jgi:hypothetical protein
MVSYASRRFGCEKVTTRLLEGLKSTLVLEGRPVDSHLSVRECFAGHGFEA